MNSTYKILDITFWNFCGFGNHNVINFRNIPSHEVIGFNPSGMMKYAIEYAIDFCLFSRDDIKSMMTVSADFLLCVLTLEKDNRRFRIRRMGCVHSNQVTIITSFYEIVVINGRETIKSLNGINDAETYENITNFFGKYFDWHNCTRRHIPGFCGLIGDDRVDNPQVNDCNLITVLKSHMRCLWSIKHQGELGINGFVEKLSQVENMVNDYLSLVMGELRQFKPILKIRYDRHDNIQIDCDPLDPNPDPRNPDKEFVNVSGCLIVDVILSLVICEVFLRPRPNLYIFNVSKLWIYLDEQRIDIILRYVHKQFEHVIIVYDENMTLGLKKLEDIINVPFLVRRDPVTGLKHVDYHD